MQFLRCTASSQSGATAAAAARLAPVLRATRRAGGRGAISRHPPKHLLPPRNNKSSAAAAATCGHVFYCGARTACVAVRNSNRSNNNNRLLLSFRTASTTGLAAAAARRWNASSSRPLFQSRPLQQQQQQRQHAAVVASGGAGAAGGGSSSRWKRIARIIRYIRIPVLVVSVYSLGYQQGVIDCTKEPLALQNQMLTGILVSTGCQDPERGVHIVSETDISWHSRQRHHQIAAVGHKIVSTARDYVEAELEQAMDKVRSNLPDDITPEAELLAMEVSESVQFWYQSRLRLEGESLVKQPWQYIFIESPAPNAFVTEILPRRFFITTGMLQVAETPDELAVVLGHEVSHLILGHVSSANKIETALRTVEVLLLSMDPTAGLLSVFVMGLIYSARRAASAAHSRGNELQADELGLKLAARACYDTEAGSHVMYKMHQSATGLAPASRSDVPVVPPPPPPPPSDSSSSARAVVRLMDTHPPSLERWERMKQSAAAGENYQKYPECAHISTRLFNALWSTLTSDGGSESENEK